ncbi:MAG: cytochrome c biogenesis protein [candidate division KSB1 bacterium]|nr:cytochrome c biogenesis protein [candidate division KSB1 bacterium]
MLLIYLAQWLVVAAYLLALVYHAKAFRHGSKVASTRAGQLMTIAVILHFVYLIILTISLRHLPVTDVFEAMTTCVWLFGVVYLSLEWRFKERSLGLFISPVIIILQIISNLFLDLHHELPEILRNVVFEIHVLTMLLSYSAFAIAFIASVLYLLLSRDLERKSQGIFYQRLPSLAFFDSLSTPAIGIGLIFLTAGIGLGIYTGLKLPQPFFTSWDPKFFAVGLTWLIYALHLLFRRALGWQGKRAAVVSLLGFGWVLFSFLVVSLMFSKIHQFQ